MKYLMLITMLLLSGCAGEHTILVKDCKWEGSDLWRCKEIPQKDTSTRGDRR